jgi:DNA adenine methylase
MNNRKIDNSKIKVLNLFQYQGRSKSPLRYPGGKQRVIKYLKECFPKEYKEYREPFLGGGSVFLEVKSQQKCDKFWVNDLNKEVYFFWQQVQSNLPALVDRVASIKKESHNRDGRSLWIDLVYSNPQKSGFIDIEKLTPLERAARFFVLNRTTFSGTIECGGYSQYAFDKRFTDSSVERLAQMSGTFNEAQITCVDYSEMLLDGGSDVFTFLDPPYHKNRNSRLYGRKGGLLHLLFDHALLAENLKKCQHQWLLTCDDCKTIRDLFSFANIKEFEIRYSINNVDKQFITPNRELLISNYDFTGMYLMS